MNQITDHQSGSGSLNATQLKFIAILAMLIDHIAWAFVPTASFQGQVMHAIGRFTFPVMAFFVAEGFHYTRNYKKYLGRMLVFAVISHLAFQYFNFGRVALLQPVAGDSFMTFAYTSIMYTFSLGLIALWVMVRWKVSVIMRYLIVALLCILAYPGDYMYFAPVLIMLFGQNFGDRPQQLRMGVLVIGFLVILSLQSNWRSSLFMIATFIPLLFLARYDGTRGPARHPLIKYSFYVFYPLHLFLLGFIRYELLGLPPISGF